MNGEKRAIIGTCMESQNSSLRAGWKSNEEVFLSASGGRNRFQEVNLLCDWDIGLLFYLQLKPLLKWHLFPVDFPDVYQPTPKNLSLSLPWGSMGCETIWNMCSHFYLYFSYLLLTPPPLLGSKFLRSREYFTIPTTHTHTHTHTHRLMYRGSVPWWKSICTWSWKAWILVEYAYQPYSYPPTNGHWKYLCLKQFCPPCSSAWNIRHYGPTCGLRHLIYWL